MKKRHLTEAQEQARDERRAAFRKIARKISDMTPEARASLAASMPGIITIEGRALSAFNCCLIYFQSCGRPVTVVGGFRQWIKSGRCVRKGEHGYAIWVPCGKRTAESGEGEAGESGESDSKPGFICGTVFDVTQTDEVNPAIEVDAVNVPERLQLTEGVAA